MKSKIPGFEVGDITIMPMDGPTAQEVQQIFQMNQNVRPSFCQPFGACSITQRQAITCSKAGDHIAAEKWHRKALSAKYAAKLGNDTIGISENGLGETLYDLGKYDEAEEHLKKALAIRQKLGSRYLFDIAVTRENLAQVYQAKKDVKMARETRQQGEAKGELCCSNYTVRIHPYYGIVSVKS